MDTDEFRLRGKEMIDYIADYLTNISQRRVTPEVEPGYLRPMLPKNAPDESESWNDIMKDVEIAIMPGITHWQHPRFHAYFPAGNSYPSILGEMLSAGLGIVGFSWAASPACTELETIMLDWLGRMMALPRVFLPFDINRDYKDSDDETNSDTDYELSDVDNDDDVSDVAVKDELIINGKKNRHKGGGVLLGSASECVLVAMLCARAKKIASKRLTDPLIEDGQVLSKLVAYTSKLAHSCVEKAGLIAVIKVRQLYVDEHYSLRGKVLEESIRVDKEKGLIPFFVSGTLGTTSCCSYDNLEEIGEICRREQLWFHVDGAYAGSAFICEEFRYLMKGIQYADSFNTNPNKWLLMNFDCSCFWVRDKFALINAMSVDPLYLQHKHAQKAVDYRHWGVALSRRFRALKLWFTIRSYGVTGLRHYVREHCRLAKVFEVLIRKDNRFEIIGDVTLGLVCFRLIGSNKLSQKLLLSLNDSGKIHMVPSMVKELYIIRFAVCSKYATDDDMRVAFDIIQTHANDVIQEYKAMRGGRLSSTSSDSLDLLSKVPPSTSTIGDTPEPTTAVSDETNIPDQILTNSTAAVVPSVPQQQPLTPTKPKVTFEKTALINKRPRAMFTRMVSDAKLYLPKRTLSQISRQASLANPRTRKRMQSDANGPRARSSSERYLARTVSILETVNSDGELEE
ncbi:unnamed protein product [Didymodactylos carnosus]|nr:unnamed protein product [Didymodactylos carnosus]CAF3733820.1 unnamed protein product [Didymodactylos carnosus]